MGGDPLVRDLLSIAASLGLRPVEVLLLLVVALAAPTLIYWIRIARGAREGLRWKLQCIARALIGYTVAVWLMLVTGQQVPIVLIVGVMAAVLAGNSVPRRSRGVPARIRRSVIAAWEAETGKTFDSREYEIDHVVPFSRGGSHTEDNLRIISRRSNRRKGRRLPTSDELM